MSEDEIGKERLPAHDATGTALETLVCRIGSDVHEPSAKQTNLVATKVILAPRDGYLCTGNLLDLRMRHSKFVAMVVPFAAWDTHLEAIPAHFHKSKTSLLSLLRCSPGALVLKQLPGLSYGETLTLLDKDFEMRLSFDWMLPTKPAPRRVAVVCGRPMYDKKSGMHASECFFEAAQGLGISMVIFDNPGHWLEGEEYAYLREAFIAVDMSDKEALPEKIAELVWAQDRHIDGIVTFTDDFVIATAEAAEILGLPTEPAQVMVQAHHKHEMRKLVNQTNIQVLCLNSVGELNDPALAEKLESLQYPIIVKPSRGQFSKGVKKVADDAGMREAVRLLGEYGLTGEGILLETYVDGPELDANFVLWDGQVLFLEVTDNFPCLGDADDATLENNFAETVLISNSRLPPEEVDIIRSSLLRGLLKLGFRSGVFHVEARMQNSSMRYEDVRGDGILDLVVKNGHTNGTSNDTSNGTNGTGCSAIFQAPDAFLIEVNARSPGTGGTWATIFTYGVDMGALQFLHAVNDRARFAALAHPFSTTQPPCSLVAQPGGGGGAQYWGAHCMIPIHRPKLWVPHDFFEKMYQDLPEVVPYVTRAEMYATPGTVVALTGGIGWIGYLLVYSRESRRHALEMYYRLAEVAKKVLDEESRFVEQYEG